MAYLPKDFSRHESKIIFNLTLKQILVLGVLCGCIFGIYKITFLHLIIRIFLMIPLVLVSLFLMFYKTEEGDDALTYLLELFIYYVSPKFLVYKRENKNERRDV